LWFDQARLVVSQGLDAGEIVVTADVQALHSGQKVRVFRAVTVSNLSEWALKHRPLVVPAERRPGRGHNDLCEFAGRCQPQRVSDTWYQVRKTIGVMRHTLPAGLNCSCRPHEVLRLQRGRGNPDPRLGNHLICPASPRAHGFHLGRVH
jgi:hypothetical protein